MKNKINIVLALCLALLACISIMSVRGPIDFNATQMEREKAVKERLVGIRTLERLWQSTHEGRYTNSFDSLASLLKSGNITVTNSRGEKSTKSVMQLAFRNAINPDSLAYIPYSEGKKFTLQTSVVPDKSGETVRLFECSAPIETYMTGMNEKRIQNAREAIENKNKYAGLKVGSIQTPNNNAGNWE